MVVHMDSLYVLYQAIIGFATNHFNTFQGSFWHFEVVQSQTVLGVKRAASSASCLRLNNRLWSYPFLKTDMELVGSFPGHNLYGTYNILCFLETTYIQTPWNIHCDVFGSFVDVVHLLQGPFSGVFTCSNKIQQNI